ncbi:MAG: mechanosensitive ion channel family protein [Candidatus Micrarchaeaceae archaeon]
MMQAKKSRDYEAYAVYGFILFLASIIFAILIDLILTRLSAGIDEKLSIELIVVIAFGATIIEVLGKSVFLYITSSGIKAEASPIRKLIRAIGYITLFFVALSVIGVNVTAALISAGFLGVVLGLAAQSTLGNLFAGLAIILAKPLEPGDYITFVTWQYGVLPPTFPHDKLLPGFSGTVDEVGLIYTKMIGEDNTPIYIPNSIINQALILNHREAKKRTVKLTFDVSKKVKLEILEKRISELLSRKGLEKFSKISLEYVGDTSYRVSLYISAGWSAHEESEMRGEILKEVYKVIAMLERTR